MLTVLCLKMSSNEEMVIRANLIVLNYIRQKKAIKEANRRKYWVHPIFMEKMRKAQGIHDNLIVELKLNDPSKFFNYLRMSPSSFDKLLALVGPSIIKKDSRFRESINPSTRLALTLRYFMIYNTNVHKSSK